MALAVYHTLAAGKGYLEYWATLDTDRQTESQAVASRFIDGEFSDWDRTAWSGDAVPPDVQQIAEWVASAEYLERSFAKQNPDGADLELPDALMAKADKWCQRSRRRGWVLSPTGERIWTRSGTRSSMNVEATR